MNHAYSTVAQRGIQSIFHIYELMVSWVVLIKRPVKSGISTYDPNLSEIYFIKTQFSILFFSKGHDRPWSSSLPSNTSEPLLLRRELLYFLSFVESGKMSLKSVEF